MSEQVVAIILQVVVGVLVVFAGWWAVTHPNRSKKHPGRIRLPIFFPIIGWLLLVVGAFMTLVAFTLATPTLGMQIAAVAILAGGLLFLLLYRNFYVAPEAEGVHFRTLFGAEKHIQYEDIVEVRHYERDRQPFVMVRASDGVKLDLNPSMYDLSPMFAYLESKDAVERQSDR